MVRSFTTIFSFSITKILLIHNLFGLAVLAPTWARKTRPYKARSARQASPLRRKSGSQCSPLQWTTECRPLRLTDEAPLCKLFEASNFIHYIVECLIGDLLITNFFSVNQKCLITNCTLAGYFA